MRSLKVRFFHGQSMRGTFQDGDLLLFETVSFQDLCVGDIVIFAKYKYNGYREEIAHRLVGRTLSGGITSGDACKNVDTTVLTEHNLLGRVCYKKRNSRVSVVHGGIIGRAKGMWLNFYWRLRRGLVWVIQPLYDKIKTFGIAARCWQPSIRRIQIQSENGICIHYVWRGRVVARTWPEQERFKCRKPWDLVIRDFSSAQR